MQFGLLGNLEVTVAQEERISLPPKLRTILALLLVSQNKIVPTSQFVDELWMGDPPMTAMATIQTYIYQLRKLLGIGSGVKGDEISLITEPSGYQLSVPAECVDVPVFERAFHAGRDAFLQGDYDRALKALGAALSVWRASALCDVQKGHWLEAYAAKLEETRTQATELRIEAYLKAGRALDAIRELQSLTVIHPLHEGLHAKLMVALHRSGRRHEALDIYRRLRSALAEELGIDPSRVIQKLERALLAADPALDASAEAAPGQHTVLAVPAQLPADIPDFVARDFVLSRAESLAHPGGGGQAPPVISVTGMGGVGKTTTAIRLAHRLRRRFPDGQFFTQLTSPTGEVVDPRDTLGEFLFAVGFSPSQIPAKQESRSQLFRSWCADRKVLILLDDVAYEDQVRPLLPGGPQCMVIVTRNSPLYGLSGIQNVELRPLESDEAFELFVRIAGMPRSDKERLLVRSIVASCGNLPAAVRAIAGKLAHSGNLSLEKLVERLSEERTRLSEMSSAGVDVRARFERSYVKLDAEAKLLLHLLGREEGRTFSAADAAGLLEVDTSYAESLLQRIYDARLLIMDDSSGRTNAYLLPDLVRLFTLERCREASDLHDLTGRASTGRSLGAA
ncbi:BTAD domain-containing putative transcriptional regulator [Streptomyces sp. NPDC001668]|uniref:AfsR/SARP family transcriptional regulator n=1 Tax=unclassified Streptomyces TaxID=2593676 RepID=UPI0033D45CFC